MPPETVIRIATANDLAAVNDIYNYYVMNSVCTYQETPSTNDERRSWFDAHGPSHPITIAQIGKEVVGYGSLSRFHERSAYRLTVENSIYVRHDFIGKGIGTALLRDLIDRARSLDHHAIIAGADSEQTASLHLHERHGFVRCADFKQVGFKFGRWLDVIYLELLLSGN